MHNTPKDAVVVTNKEKVLYAQKQGYNTKEYMDADQIKSIRDKRFRQACSGNANTAYSLKNVATASVKAGVMGAVIGMTIETITLYKAWKTGELSDMNYGRQILKASGDAGVTAGTTTAIMVPVNSIITVAGVSSLVTIPVAIVLGSAINRIVAPCFGRGEYNEILDKAKYYVALEEAYNDFIYAADTAAKQYIDFVAQMQAQTQQFLQMQQMGKCTNQMLKVLYDSI